MRTTAIHNLIIRRPRFSLSLSPSVLTRQSLSLACAITHTIIIICSRYARRALASCSLFKFFLPFALLLLSSDHSKKGGEREKQRERKRESRRRKEICVQITQIFYEWTHRGEKGKNSLFAHTHTNSSFSLLYSLLFLFVAAIYFFYCFYLSW
jgi:hypothetical protein